jgi:hypothetical protein
VIADRHYWRTSTGGLVPTGHPDAEVLAYPAGDDLPDEVARELGLADPPRATPAKQAPKSASKLATKPANK